ncbi:hypothetical protein GDO81_004840 [Engystomops pustulosus]|uniref:Uncharacterized protein n=1 Tax=Engystomops pustulosus TaxID=76066 RepID=A0AAV7CJL1_ENGPU|nr:hypothetical protein GDO81_004840 [Engystomops pustulosus]
MEKRQANSKEDIKRHMARTETTNKRKMREGRKGEEGMYRQQEKTWGKTIVRKISKDSKRKQVGCVAENIKEGRKEKERKRKHVHEEKR